MPLQHLDNDALLLAYLAGELPAEGRVRVAEMLADDAALSARLDDLRGAFTGVEDALRSADAAEPLALSAAAASRRFGREVRAWQTRGGAQAEVIPGEQPSRRRLRIPGWVYPVATAAAVLLAYTIWWRANPDTRQFAFLRSRPSVATRMPDNLDYPMVPPTALTDGEYAFDIGAWTTPNALVDREEAATESALSDTEAELYALSGPGVGDDDDVPTSLLLGELE